VRIILVIPSQKGRLRQLREELALLGKWLKEKKKLGQIFEKNTDL